MTRLWMSVARLWALVAVVAIVACGTDDEAERSKSVQASPIGADGGDEVGSGDAAAEGSSTAEGGDEALRCELPTCAWLDGEDACQEVRTPSRQATFVEDSGQDTPPFYLAISELWLQPRAPESERIPIGFNLDDACTGLQACGEERAQPSCMQAFERSDSSYCVDNALGELLALSEAAVNMQGLGTNPEMVNCGLYHGDYTQLLRISEYNGTDNDAAVRLDIYFSPGLEQPIDGWRCPLADPEERAQLPSWEPGSRFMVSELDVAQSQEPAEGLPPSLRATEDAYVENGLLVAYLPEEMAWGFRARDVGDASWMVTARRGLLVGQLVSSKDGFRLEAGVMAARSTTEDVLASLRRSGLCPNSETGELFSLLSETITDHLDVLVDGDQDPERPCDALSHAFAFTAVPAQAGEVLPQRPLMDCCLNENQGTEVCPENCGDGILQQGERCDTGIAAGAPGACPTSCSQQDACHPQRLVGSGCEARCQVTAISQLQTGDGCCPPGASATRDGDCEPACGNGILDAGESCDPPEKCPTAAACTSEDACVVAELRGSAKTCDASCDRSQVVACIAGDGCCPAGCSASDDGDCTQADTCGNGQRDPSEACDGDDCPTMCSPTADACRSVSLTGSAESCTARCVEVPITGCASGDGCCPSENCNAENDGDCDPVCGNGVVESGETCDDGNSDAEDGCHQCQLQTNTERCQAQLPGWFTDRPACAACVCERCGDPALSCVTQQDENRRQLCQNLLSCAHRTNCRGRDCLCERLSCYVARFDGPCANEVRAAAAIEPGQGVIVGGNVPGYPVSAAQDASSCIDRQCGAQCR